LSEPASPWPNVGRFIGVRVLMGLAYQMQAVALGWFVYDLTGSALSLGLIGLAQFLPAIPLMAVVGYVADHFDRRRVLVASLAAQVAAVLGLFAAVSDRSPSMPLVYAIVLGIGAARSFAQPATQAILPNLVPVEVLPRALALSSSINQMATIAGPAFGGLVFAAIGVRIFLVNAGLLVAAAVLALTLPAIQTLAVASAQHAWRRSLMGLSYVWSNKLVLGSISLDLFAVLLGGVTALMPIFARDILKVGPEGLGLLQSGPAIGAVAVGLLLAYLPLKRRVGAIMLWCVAGYGVATIVFGLSTNFALSMACLIALGAFDMASVVIRQALVQIATPDEMRGRVGAVNSVFVGASNQLGAFESGLVASLVGAVPAAVIGGVGVLAVVALTARLFPDVRKADRLYDIGG
jgi:MFS family permease